MPVHDLEEAPFRLRWAEPGQPDSGSYKWPPRLTCGCKEIRLADCCLAIRGSAVRAREARGRTRLKALPGKHPAHGLRQLDLCSREEVSIPRR
jgi:hypothetical protein